MRDWIFAFLETLTKKIIMSETTTQKESGFYKWEVLILLWFAYWFNQADRQIYNTLIGDIRNSLQMTDADAGLVATVFMWVLAICFPLAGFAVDRFGKKGIIVFSLILWSAATVVSGACTAFFLFIIFRCVATGVGEGFFSPAAYTSLSEYHEKDTRATAISIYTTAQYLGIVVCGGMAGWLVDKWVSLQQSGSLNWLADYGLGALANYEGWRVVFFLFGSLGVLLGIVILLRLRDKYPPSAQQKSANSKSDVSVWESVKVFFSIPSAILLTVSFSGVVFVVQAYLTWSTDYLRETFNMTRAEAGFNAVLWMHAGAFFGILIAGKLSDLLAMKKKQYRVLLQSFGYISAVPFIVLIGFATPVKEFFGLSDAVCGVGTTIALIYIGMIGFGFFRGFYDANIYPTLYDVVPSKYRGSATGIMLFIGFLLASPGPWILGLLKPIVGLHCGIALLSVVWLVLGIMLLFIYKLCYARDCQSAIDYDLTHR